MNGIQTTLALCASALLIAAIVRLLPVGMIDATTMLIFMATAIAGVSLMVYILVAELGP